MLFQKPSVDFILVGLGNPGAEYEKTRHNVGFRCIDALARQHQFKVDRLKCQALTCRTTLAGFRVLVVKPMTYMNLSGQAVQALAKYYGVDPAHILVIFDDISLPVGRIRIRPQGSAGGHNGIKSIIAQLGSQDFPRVKIGVGEKPHPDYALKDWVLSSFSAAEEKLLQPAIGWATEAVLDIMANGCAKAAADFNGKK